MTTPETSPAKKEFCVWADHVRRVYQHVEAPSPKQAHDTARDQPECWEDCFEHEDRDDYRLSNEVQDLETEAYYAIRATTHCKTCGSDIAETINDSNFHEGECGPCEYRRYTSQPALVDAANIALGFVGAWEKEKQVTEPTTVRRWLEAALTQADHGNAA